MFLAVISVAASILIKFIIVIVGLVGAHLTRPNIEDPRKNRLFRQRNNEALADDPILMVYGIPVYHPPIVASWAEAESIDSTTGTEEKAMYMVAHMGTGPLEGKHLRLWNNDTPLISGSVSRKNLIRLDDSRKRWLIPDGNVDEKSLSVYVNGVFVGGADVPTDAEYEQVTRELVSPHVFESRAPTKLWGNDDPDLTYIDSDIQGSRTRVFGAIFPLQGAVDSWSMTIKVIRGATRGWGNFGSFGGFSSFGGGGITTQSMTHAEFGSFIVPCQDIVTGTTDAGEEYFWIKGLSSQEQKLIKYFELTYKAVPRNFKITQEEADTILEFTTGLDVGVIPTANYTTGAAFDIDKHGVKAFDYMVQFGHESIADELKLPHGQVRSTRTISTRLERGINVEYDSVQEVDDMHVHIDAQQGMFSIDQGKVKGMLRRARIFVKETLAADQATDTNEPAKGWVLLKVPVEAAWPGWGTDIPLYGSSADAVRWTFSVGNLLARQKSGGSITQGKLPGRKKYSVRVLLINAEDADIRTGEVDSAIYHSKLWLDGVTEIIDKKVRFPDQALIVLQFNRPEMFETEGEIRVQVASRQVYVPDENAQVVRQGDRWVPLNIIPQGGDDQFIIETYPKVFSRNPVWCVCDLLTDPVNGSGNFYDWRNVDLVSAMDAAAFCDEIVSNPDGSTEVRSEVDIALKDRKPVIEWLADILTGSGVTAYLSGGVWKFVTERDIRTTGSDADEVFDITDALTVGGKDGNIPMITHVGIEELPTELEIVYPNEKFDYEEDRELIALPIEEMVGRGVLSEQIDCPAVRRTTQILRWGWIALRQIQRQILSMECMGAGWEFLKLEPGDFCTWQSDDMGFDSRLYRVQGLSKGSNFVPALVVAEHDGSAFREPFKGPNSGVKPGTRTPTDETPTVDADWSGTATTAVAVEFSITRVFGNEKDK